MKAEGMEHGLETSGEKRKLQGNIGSTEAMRKERVGHVEDTTCSMFNPLYKLCASPLS
jgi:hypothetical protein